MPTKLTSFAPLTPPQVPWRSRTSSNEQSHNSMFWTRLRLVTRWMGLLCVLFWPSHVVAQQPTAKTKAQAKVSREAERLFLEGNRLAQNKRYEEALAKYLSSQRILSPPANARQRRIRNILHSYIGRTYQLTNRPIRARDHYRLYLKLVLKDKRRRSSVSQWLTELRPKLKASVKLTVLPPADCVLRHPGGKWRGQSPATVTVEAGRLSIQCRADDHFVLKRGLVVTPRTLKEWTLILKRKPAPRPRVPVQPTMSPDRRWIAWVVMSLGVATAGTGGVFGYLAQQDQDASAALRDQLVEQGNLSVEDTRSVKTYTQDAQRKAFTANTLFISGGAVALTGVILYFVLRPRPIVAKAAQHPSTFPPNTRKATLLWSTAP